LRGRHVRPAVFNRRLRHFEWVEVMGDSSEQRRDHKTDRGPVAGVLPTRIAPCGAHPGGWSKKTGTAEFWARFRRSPAELWSLALAPRASS